MKNEPSLSPRERAIMDLIYQNGEMTASQVQEELPGNSANATVRTLLRILETKGHLKHSEQGRTFLYSATRPRNREGQSALKRIIGVFYEGSAASAVAGLLKMKDTELSDDELNELDTLIQTAKRKNKN